jgi:CRISPR-associated protein Cas1
VVDTPAGDLPAQDVEGDDDRFGGRRATSIWLTSETLRISAKLDLVEVAAHGVVPVDYKKGHPGRDGRAWPSDEIQSVLQVLLLREAGYRVDQAEIWYAETRQRVIIPIDDPLLERTRRILSEVWRVAAQDEAPPPLVDSPKCAKCSLVGICLPDETNALLTRGSIRTGARRVIPDDPASRPVYVQEQGSVVGVRRGRLEIFKEKELLSSYRLIDVSQLCIQGNVTVTPQAMRELFARETPVCWFTYGGWFSGIAQGLPGKNVDLRRCQVLITPEAALDIARRMIEGKIRNSRTTLKRNSREDLGQVATQLTGLSTNARAAQGFPTLLGLEGTAARIYFNRFRTMISDDARVDTAAFDANGRARRPPPDPLNALLSFVYALLVKDLTTMLFSVGFDPYQGIYHRPRYGRPALALDLAEEFRPLVGDSVVLQLLNNGEIRESDFRSRAGGCQLEKDGRRAVLRAYERRLAHEIKHPVFGYRVSYRRAFEVQGRLLAAHLTGELPEYIPFTTR